MISNVHDKGRGDSGWSSDAMNVIIKNKAHLTSTILSKLQIREADECKVQIDDDV